MIAEIIRTLKMLKAKAVEALAKVFSPDTAYLPDPKTIFAASESIMNTGKWYRKTSGHSPVFSLYTFFGLR